MKCVGCQKEIYNVPKMEAEPVEYWGSTLTTFEYTLECEHCHREYEIDPKSYYESRNEV